MLQMMTERSRAQCRQIPRLIYTCAMTHLYVCHDSLTHPVRTCSADTSNAADDDKEKSCAMLPNAMAHLYVCHDSFIRATWLTHTRHISHSYVQHRQKQMMTKRSRAQCRQISRLIYTCAMTHSYASHVPFMYAAPTEAMLQMMKDASRMPPPKGRRNLNSAEFLGALRSHIYAQKNQHACIRKDTYVCGNKPIQETYEFFLFSDAVMPYPRLFKYVG